MMTRNATANMRWTRVVVTAMTTAVVVVVMQIPSRERLGHLGGQPFEAT